MSACPKCKQRIVLGEQICRHCGTAINWSCPDCRSKVFPGAETCFSCGAKLYWETKPHLSHSRTNTATKSMSQAKTDLSGSGKEAKTSWFCPDCHFKVEPGTKACGNCGTKLLWETKPEPPASRTEGRQGSPTLNFLGWIVAVMLMVVVAGLAFFYFAPGYGMYLVRSESMKPAIKMGDLIVTGPANNTIRPGTVVTYAHGTELVTHRVISVENNKLVTKGDAVEDPDPSPIAMSQVRGVYLFKIPSLGYLANFMHTKFGWFLVIIVPTILLLVLIFWEIVKEVLKKPQQGSYT